MDILDLFNDGALACGEIQNIRTEEEIRKWTTDENLSDTSKATLLLVRGFGLQKAAILSNLPRLASDPDFSSVIDVLVREVPTWDESLQIEAGNGLIAPISNCLLPATQYESLLKVTFELFSMWSEAVHAVWIQVFTELIRQLDLAVVKKMCVSAVIRLGEFAQPVETRLLATRLIGVLADRLTGEFKGDILQKALMLAQDTHYEIRRSMCVEMRHICRAVPAEHRSRALDEVLQLASDEEVEVQCEAVSSLIDLADLLPMDCAREHVLPLIQSSLFDSCDLMLTSHIMGICGKVLVQVTEHFQDEAFTRSFLRFFQSLCGSDSDSDRKTAAFQFPGVISALGETAFVENLIESYEALTRDREEEVRVTMAASLHEVARLLPGEAAAMSDIFCRFLTEKKTASVVLKHLSDILPLLSSGWESDQVLAQLISLLSSTLPWRQVDSLLEQLVPHLSLFRLQDILDTLQPALLSLYPKACLPVKVRTVQFFAFLIHFNFMSERRHELCTSILLLLSKSRHYQDRILFVEFCMQILQLNSRRFFHKFFYSVFIRMTQDPVRNVRLKVALGLVTLQAIFFADEEMHSGLSAAIEIMMMDRDLEVARLATEAHNLTLKPDYWTSLQDIETKEREREAREDRQVQQEIREREEAKKRLVQELTEKARMDYLQSYKDKKNAANKAPKGGLLKGSATSARLITVKTKFEGQKHSSSANTSPKLGPTTTVIKPVPMKVLPPRKK